MRFKGEDEMKITAVQDGVKYDVEFLFLDGKSKLGTNTVITKAIIYIERPFWRISVGLAETAKHPKDQHNEDIATKTAFRRALKELTRYTLISEEERSFLWSLFFTYRKKAEMFDLITA